MLVFLQFQVKFCVEFQLNHDCTPAHQGASHPLPNCRRPLAVRSYPSTWSLYRSASVLSHQGSLHIAYEDCGFSVSWGVSASAAKPFSSMTVTTASRSSTNPRATNPPRTHM